MPNALKIVPFFRPLGEHALLCDKYGAMATISDVYYLLLD